MNRLEGKVVVLVGAGGGIGRAAARALAAEGASLVLASRRESALRELAQELTDKGAKTIYQAADVTNELEVKALFDKAADTFGRLDVLVNMAGVSIPASIAEMTEEQYERTMDVNVKGTFLCSKHYIPYANAEGSGALIVNVGSMAAKRANANAPLYCTAKAAVNMLSQGLALQLAEKNIRVTTLNPGATDTGFWGTRKVPREKFMTAEDVAEVLLFVVRMDPRVVVHEISFDCFAFMK